MDYRVIKGNDLFLMTDLAGDIPEGQTQGFGLYAKDTRFLSRMELLINGRKPNVLAYGPGLFMKTYSTKR